jgi:hypothetical protein
MNKLAVIAALALATNAKMGTVYYYDDAYSPCFEWDDTTMAWVVGNVDAFADDSANGTSDSDGNKYNYAFDITIDGTSADEYYCDNVNIQAWNVEWTVNTADADAVDAMFAVYYEEWTWDVDTCSGSYADDTSTAFTSGEDVYADMASTTCAYDVYAEYMDGTDSSGNTLSASTQDFTVYTDNSVVTAVSAFALAGVAAMFF